ncbi:cytochrome c oxidase subunit II [Nocardioides sp. KR10-350]|uniref:aa3-type cytochrome oxidase subunit II n=1 Tax=Nocardioides cheoyonin TaxID=3156615 RepID=UPI0032B54A93
MPGLHSPAAKRLRPAGSGVRRGALLATLAAGSVLLAGCSGEAERLGMPDPKSEEGEHILHLWQGAWIAALITGVIVWGLIFWVIWRYRRRSEADVPVQTRYNLPLEIFYTIAPVLMVIVFFSHTVKAQNAVLDDDITPDNVIEVTGQQWQWTFNYGLGSLDNSADDDLTDDTYPYSNYAFDSGTGSHIPVLVLPAGKTTRFNLHSADVIHDFGIPDFDMKMDVVPGRVNHYAITTKSPTAVFDSSQPDLLKPASSSQPATFRGACYELCGLYHGRMIFRVAILSASDYQSYVQALSDKGFETGGAPYTGGGKSTLPADLNAEGSEAE